MQPPRPIVVIGAGVIGLNVAWRLAQQGASVTLVEAHRPGSGTTSTSFAWVNASSKIGDTAAYFELNALALKEHHALSLPLGPRGWFRPSGHIDLAADPEGATALEHTTARLSQHGYAAERLSAQSLDRLEPGTRMPAGGTAAFHPDEGWADTARMTETLLSFCREAGVTVIETDPAKTVLQRNGAATGVRLASGLELEAEAVVLGLGRWTADFAAGLGLDIPLVGPNPMGSKAIGLLARVKLKGGAPTRLLHSPGINWSPLADGRALLASDAGDTDVSGDRSPAAAQANAATLVARAAALNPLFEGATVEEAQIGIRALPKDGVAICGWVPQLGALYVAVTHSGVTLSPLLGRLVADEVMGEGEQAILSTFRPDRFGEAA